MNSETGWPGYEDFSVQRCAEWLWKFVSFAMLYWIRYSFKVYFVIWGTMGFDLPFLLYQGVLKPTLTLQFLTVLHTFKALNKSKITSKLQECNFLNWGSTLHASCWRWPSSLRKHETCNDQQEDGMDNNADQEVQEMKKRRHMIGRKEKTLLQ